MEKTNKQKKPQKNINPNSCYYILAQKKISHKETSGLQTLSNR